MKPKIKNKLSDKDKTFVTAIFFISRAKKVKKVLETREEERQESEDDEDGFGDDRVCTPKQNFNLKEQEARDGRWEWKRRDRRGL